jgi:hypothetical protein
LTVCPRSATDTGRRPRRLSIQVGQALSLAFLGFLPTAAGAAPLRGDLDEDGTRTITDAISILGFLFLSGTPPYCEPVADVTGDGAVNITDPVRLLNHLFIGEAPPSELSAEELTACGGNNLPPALPERPLYRAHPGYLVEFALGAVDPEGDNLHYEAQGLPAGASLDAATGVFRWTPAVTDVGRVEVTCAVSDEGRPPNRVEGTLAFEVLPADPCRPVQCDPATGCELLPPIDDLATECCGDPGTRLPDPDVPCPDGALFHVGRNPSTATTIGRLQNCDLLRVAALAQGGYGVHTNIEARCIDASFLVEVRARLETAEGVLVSGSMDRFFNRRADGYYEARSLGFLAEGQFSEGAEAYLTVSLKDTSGKRLERRLRVVLTTSRLEDLP